MNEIEWAMIIFLACLAIACGVLTWMIAMDTKQMQELERRFEELEEQKKEEPKKSEWRVTSNVIGGTWLYAAYRLIDVTEPDNSGNREYCGGWDENEARVTALVYRLKKGAGPE